MGEKSHKGITLETSSKLKDKKYGKSPIKWKIPVKRAINKIKVVGKEIPLNKIKIVVASKLVIPMNITKIGGFLIYFVTKILSKIFPKAQRKEASKA